MRNLTVTAASEIAKQYGIEPFFIVEVFWTDNTSTKYSTKSTLALAAKVLSISPIRSALTQDSFDVATVSIVLDDTDGSIKAELATHDIHKQRCVVYQMFEGLVLADAITLFTGTISSPFLWSEGEKQVTLNATSEIEQYEVGFSPEEGQLSWVTEEAVGKPWPLAFGEVKHLPAVKVHQIQHAKLLDKFTIVDPLLYYHLQQTEWAYQQANILFTYYSQLHTGIHQIVPTASGVLSDYVQHILALDDLQLLTYSLLRDMQFDRNAMGFAPADVALRTQFRLKWNITLPNLTAQMQVVHLQLEQDKQNITTLQWLYDMDKQAIQNMVNAYNQMRDLWIQYKAIQEEICLQTQTQTVTVRVEGESIYPDGEPTEVCIKKSKFEVQFDHDEHTMTFLDGPLNQYEDYPIESWTADDEPCSGIAEMDGVDLFRIDSDNPPDWNDMYVLCESTQDRNPVRLTLTGSSGGVHLHYDGADAAELNPVYGDLHASDILSALNNIPALVGNITVEGGQGGPWFIYGDVMWEHELTSTSYGDCNGAILYGSPENPGKKKAHILKVRRQDGNKIYFEAKKWNDGNTQSGSSYSINTIVNRIVEPSSWTYVGGINGLVPNGLFTGDMDPTIWLQPQGQLLLSILSGIPTGVNLEELKLLTQACFLQAYDDLATTTITQPTARDTFTIIGEDVKSIIAVSSTIPTSWWQNYYVTEEEFPDKMGFEARPGSEIKDCDDHCEIYICNILPSQIVGVHAYRSTDTGDEVLDTVPSSYYIKDEAKSLGTYTITEITLKRALYEIPGENWSDQLYVSLISSVGPNVVDIMQWLIETYTDKTIDAVSFAAVKLLVANYPANFALFNRPNVLTELKRIAWESRIAITLKGDKFYLTYLPIEPTAVGDFTFDDIVTKTLTENYTSTESLVTRMVASYTKSYLPLRMHELAPKHVLRYNIEKYGLHEREEFFHIYNDGDLVYKSASFWMLRLANTWKNIEFEAFWLDKLVYEPLDPVTLNEQLMLLTSVEFNPMDLSIKFSVDVPIRLGESTQFPFYWPAAEEPALIEDGFGNGYGPGAGVTGTISNCPEVE